PIQAAPDPGYPAPGQTSYPAPGQTSYPAPGQTSYPAPGQTSYPAPGQTSYPVAGQPLHAEPTPAPHYAPAVPQLVSSWTPPPTVQPWMASVAPSQGMPRRLLLSDV